MVSSPRPGEGCAVPEGDASKRHFLRVSRWAGHAEACSRKKKKHFAYTKHHEHENTNMWSTQACKNLLMSHPYSKCNSSNNTSDIKALLLIRGFLNNVHVRQWSQGSTQLHPVNHSLGISPYRMTLAYQKAGINKSLHKQMSAMSSTHRCVQRVCICPGGRGPSSSGGRRAGPRAWDRPDDERIWRSSCLDRCRQSLDACRSSGRRSSHSRCRSPSGRHLREGRV